MIQLNKDYQEALKKDLNLELTKMITHVISLTKGTAEQIDWVLKTNYSPLDRDSINELQSIKEKLEEIYSINSEIEQLIK